MDNKLFKEQEKFLEFIKGYEFIDQQGRLNLENFCMHLSVCFYYDGILEQSPQPRDMYDLLIEIIRTNSNDEEMSLWVQTQKLMDWSPSIANIYPDKRKTCIHISALIKMLHLWIFHIGHTLMKIPKPTETVKYFDWVKYEWVFSHTFINGLHNSVWHFAKNIDKQVAKENGYSIFEAFHRAIRSDIDFDEAQNQLKLRNSAQNEAMTRIEKAIDAEFYLEAITLQECLISNCIFNFLEGKGRKPKKSTFQKLLYECKKEIPNNAIETKAMLNDIDKWRAQRNKAIHGFISSRSSSLSKSQNDFMKFSNSTSKKGLALCKRVCDWYIDASTKFISTEWKKNKKRLN